MLSNNGTTWRSNEEITESGSGALKTNPDKMKLDNENINDLPGSVSIVYKMEELPQSNGGSVPMDGNIPQTDKNGM